MSRLRVEDQLLYGAAGRPVRRPLPTLDGVNAYKPEVERNPLDVRADRHAWSEGPDLVARAGPFVTTCDSDEWWRCHYVVGVR